MKITIDWTSDEDGEAPMIERAKKRMREFGCVGLAALAITLVAGCTATAVEVIDLDKVITTFNEMLNLPVDGDAGGDGAADAAGDAGSAAPEAAGLATDVPDVEPVTAEEEKPEMTAEFLTQLAARLNEAKLIDKPIGVSYLTEGAIIGFSDANANMQRDGTDRNLFKLEIDPERGRVIATDLQNQYHREQGYGNTYHRRRHYGGGGLWMGYMLGSMRSRQGSYYGGAGRAAPDYGRMTMAPKGYHAKAVSDVRARTRATARSARSRGGSRSFRGGK